jgi:ribosomal protein S18 acetylase RimI-like enzyme
MSAPTYFKRYRMEMQLRDLPPVPRLPAGFDWLPWSPRLLDFHAEVKFESFRDEIDTIVFPNLGHVRGCRELMWNIVTQANFVPEATILLVGPFGACGTVQGIRDRWFGAIQNLGVVAEQRGKGLGSLLLLKSLHGFVRAGLSKAYLEVTARNEAALRIYRRLGFRSTRTIYKPVHTIPSRDECVVI